MFVEVPNDNKIKPSLRTTDLDGLVIAVKTKILGFEVLHFHWWTMIHSQQNMRLKYDFHVSLILLLSTFYYYNSRHSEQSSEHCLASWFYGVNFWVVPKEEYQTKVSY